MRHRSLTNSRRLKSRNVAASMKRTPLKRRRTKPRPAKNRPLYDRYIEDNPWSEWCLFLGITINDKGEVERWAPGTRIQASERHHIFSVNQRPDVLSLIISQTFYEHRWSHRNLTAARVLSILVKLKKGELNLEEVYRHTGKHLDGWLTTFSFDGPLAWVEPYRLEAVERLATLAIEERGRM